MGETKSKISVAIPDELVEFMRDVVSLIESRDDAAVIPSDDLLQCEAGYGGLMPDRKQFSFVYFPEGGTQVRWEFKLLADEIDEIASGWKKDVVVQKHEAVGGT